MIVVALASLPFLYVLIRRPVWRRLALRNPGCTLFYEILVQGCHDSGLVGLSNGKMKEGK